MAQEFDCTRRQLQKFSRELRDLGKRLEFVGVQSSARVEIVAIDRLPPDIREKVKENCRTATKLHKKGEFVDFEECWKINKRQKNTRSHGNLQASEAAGALKHTFHSIRLLVQRS